MGGEREKEKEGKKFNFVFVFFFREEEGVKIELCRGVIKIFDFGDLVERERGGRKKGGERLKKDGVFRCL